MEVFKSVNLSSLDVEREEDLRDLLPIFSEYGLFRYRIIVQVKWLLKLSEYPEIKEVAALSQDARDFLENIIQKFSIREILGGEETEKVPNLDARDTISFLKEICRNHAEICKVLESFKLLCTRAEVDIAYGMMVRDAIDSVILPLMADLCDILSTMANDKAYVSILSHSRGQLAWPTTLKEELKHLTYRLSHDANCVKEAPIFVQFSEGESFFFNTYPQIDWFSVAQEFVTSLSLKFNANHCNCSSNRLNGVFSSVTAFNTNLAIACREVQKYISNGHFKLEGDSIKFVGNASKLRAQNMLEALENRLPYNKTCFTVDIVGQLAYSLVEYIDILKMLKKLK